MCKLHNVTYTIRDIVTQLLPCSNSIEIGGNWTGINHLVFPYWDNQIENHFSLQAKQMQRSYYHSLHMITLKTQFEKMSFCSLIQWTSLVQPVCTWKCVPICIIPLSSHFVSKNQYGLRYIPLSSQLVISWITFIMLHYSLVDTNTNNFIYYFICKMSLLKLWTELYQEMATSSRNGHMIKTWPHHQEMSTSPKNNVFW